MRKQRPMVKQRLRTLGAEEIPEGSRGRPRARGRPELRGAAVDARIFPLATGPRAGYAWMIVQPKRPLIGTSLVLAIPFLLRRSDSSSASCWFRGYGRNSSANAFLHVA